MRKRQREEQRARVIAEKRRSGRALGVGDRIVALRARAFGGLERAAAFAILRNQSGTARSCLPTKTNWIIDHGGSVHDETHSPVLRSS